MVPTTMAALAVAALLAAAHALPPAPTTAAVGGCGAFSRQDFPAEFVFSAATSAYQVEGAAAEDGRCPSIWDTYTRAGKMVDKTTGDVACDQYHKYKEDVKLMSEMGLEAYRFSISWTRLIPNGRGYVNPKGLEYYNNLINELLNYGIKPNVMLYQLDLPQVLQDEYNGWLGPKIVDDFVEYAEVCFREFGDRVTQWTTIAQPNIMSIVSFDVGHLPPGRCSLPNERQCVAGNSSTEPYIAVHHSLLAHAAAARLYKNKYQPVQRGEIGINIYSYWFEPKNDAEEDIEAVKRADEFMHGWVLNPLVYGEYPKTMMEIVGERLPTFSSSQSELLKGSIDFIGINHYATEYISDWPDGRISSFRDYIMDMSVTFSGLKNSTEPHPPFVPSNSSTVPSDPYGLYKQVKRLSHKYRNIPIYIQENGYGFGGGDKHLDDVDRINYLGGFIASTLDAIRDGVDVRGYCVWSFMDLFEFLAGHQSRLGLFHVDFDDESLPRTPRLSARWYGSFLKENQQINLTTATLLLQQTNPQLQLLQLLSSSSSSSSN